MINKNLFKNKKAKIFSLFLVLITLVVSGFVFYAFVAQNNKNISNFRVSGEVSEFNKEQNLFLFYAESSAKAYSLEAFYDLVSNFKFAGSSCKLEGDYIEFCSISLDAENNFINFLSEGISKSLKVYPLSEFASIEYTIEINDDRINFNSPIKTRDRKMTSFDIKNSFNPSFYLDTKQIYDGVITADFKEIYNKAQECKSKLSDLEVKECMNILGYKTEVSVNSGKVFFDLDSDYIIFNNENGAVKPEKISIKFYMLR